MLRFLEDLHAAGENASDFFSLFKNLIKSSDWKRYLVECGLLERVTLLIIKVAHTARFSVRSWLRVKFPSYFFSNHVVSVIFLLSITLA